MSISIISFKSGYLENNTYLIYDSVISNRAILIDPANSYDLVFKHLEREDLKLTDVFLTHAHFDHISDTCKFADLGAKTHLHLKDLPHINDNFTKKMLVSKGREVPKIDAYIVDGKIYEFPFGLMEVLHTPGHSKGSCCFIIEENIFTGDTLFHLSYGRTDFFDGCLEEIVESISKIFCYKTNKTLYPGHGDITKLDFEREYNPINEFIR